MSEINKEALYAQFNTREPQADEVIAKYSTTTEIKESLLNFISWLKSSGASLQYADYENQSPFWEIDYNNKTYYLVLNGEDNICIMVKIDFSQKHQAIMLENNLHEIILNNLHPCTRKDGGHCNNCHLPSDVAGVDEVIFGKEIKNLCCGQFVSFVNPNSQVIGGIKKLMEL